MGINLNQGLSVLFMINIAGDREGWVPSFDEYRGTLELLQDSGIFSWNHHLEKCSIPVEQSGNALSAMYDKFSRTISKNEAIRRGEAQGRQNSHGIIFKPDGGAFVEAANRAFPELKNGDAKSVRSFLEKRKAWVVGYDTKRDPRVMIWNRGFGGMQGDFTLYYAMLGNDRNDGEIKAYAKRFPDLYPELMASFKELTGKELQPEFELGMMLG